MSRGKRSHMAAVLKQRNELIMGKMAADHIHSVLAHTHFDPVVDALEGGGFSIGLKRKGSATSTMPMKVFSAEVDSEGQMACFRLRFGSLLKSVKAENG